MMQMLAKGQRERGEQAKGTSDTEEKGRTRVGIRDCCSFGYASPSPTWISDGCFDGPAPSLHLSDTRGTSSHPALSLLSSTGAGGETRMSLDATVRSELEVEKGRSGEGARMPWLSGATWEMAG